MEMYLKVGMGLIGVGLILQIVGVWKGDGELILSGFLLQAGVLLFAIPFAASAY